jgi:hypothetical protein
MDFDGMMTKLEWLDREVGRMESEIARLTRERDALIAAAIVEDRFPRPFRWSIGWVMGYVGTRDEAVAAVRRAAGLRAEYEGG